MTQGALQTLAVVTGLALAAAAGRAAAPDDARAALNALRAGTDPGTAAVLRQIAGGAADLARARTAADSAGLPLDPARLQRRPVAPALDAAPLYVRLWALRPHGRGVDLSLDPPDPRFIYTPAQIASVRRSLVRRRPALLLAHQAASRPFCVFRRDWSLGRDVLLPEYAYQDNAARLLRTEAHLRARDGHRDAAMQDAVLVLHLADQMASDPTLPAYLSGRRLRKWGLDILADVLQTSHGSPPAARQVSQILATHPPHLSLWYAEAGETALWFASVDSVRVKSEGGWAWEAGSGRLVDSADATPAQPTSSVTPEERRLLSGLWEEAEAQTLDQTARRLTLLRAGKPPQQVAAADGAPTALQNWAARVLLLPGGPASRPKIAQIAASERRTQAQENVLETAARLLADPAAPLTPLTDPYTGRPLGLRREGRRGFVLYSAGEDGAFRGGRAADPPPYGAILFRFPAPEPVPVPDFWDGI